MLEVVEIDQQKSAVAPRPVASVHLTGKGQVEEGRVHQAGESVVNREIAKRVDDALQLGLRIGVRLRRIRFARMMEDAEGGTEIEPVPRISSWTPFSARHSGTV
jgi:hypothetical protein